MKRFKGSRLRNLAFAWLGLVLALTACQPATTAARQPAAAEPAAAEPAAKEPAATFTAVDNPASILTSTQAPEPASMAAAATAATTPQAANPTRSIWLAESVPQRLREALALPQGWAAASGPETAGLRLDVLKEPVYPAAQDTEQDTEQDANTSLWVYALAAPFPTVADEVSLAQVRRAWRGTRQAGLPFTSLLVDPITAKAFTAKWGRASSMVQVRPADRLVEAAWAARTAWAILPFEQLEPRWKVIAVGGQSPVRKDFDPARYSLAVPFALQGDPAAAREFRALASLPESNRQPSHLTTVMVTGVTALVRGTASLMEQRGLTYPAQDIGGWLREADILHISNEVAFWKTCPEPYHWEGLAFCSRTKYIELLRDVGADVIELTGDHFQDWGPESVLFTLDLYKQEGWKTYGGGANIEEARQPALFEHNGNKIAFIGCNAKPKGYATASAETPGAAHCDMDRMAADIRQLRAGGYQPIATFQHLEYYQYIAHPILQKDFRQMAAAGAAIVSGSQAHQPHALEFDNGAVLHYGLGNLFFDQTNQGDPPRTAFIDRHVFYEGRLVSTELLTIYLVDYARSRPMTLPERQELLQTIFEASGW